MLFSKGKEWARGLVKITPVREHAFRHARTVLTNLSEGKSNLTAALGHRVGTELLGNTRCTHCCNGKGIWLNCVVLPGRMNGACTNCHMHGYGKNCSKVCVTPAQGSVERFSSVNSRQTMTPTQNPTTLLTLISPVWSDNELCV